MARKTANMEIVEWHASRLNGRLVAAPPLTGDAADPLARALQRAPALIPDIPGNRLNQINPSGDTGHFGSRSSQYMCKAGAQSGTGAGDQGYPPCQGVFVIYCFCQFQILRK